MVMDTNRRLSIPTWLAIVLVVVGALNWGLVGLFDFNLVTTIFGDTSVLSRAVYVLVALAGVYLIIDTVRLSEGPRTRSIGTA